MNMELVLGLVIGIGLSAACGFRVFVPLAGLSFAAMAGHVELAPGFEWIGEWPALVAFTTATILEIGGYYIPWVDNLLDSLATPAAVVAGTVATASMMGDASPLFRWSLAVIAGGGVSGVVQSGTVLLRAGSSGTTGGLGNPLVSTGELVGSFFMTALALLLPIVCLILVVWLCFKILKRAARLLTPRRPLAAGISPGENR